MCDNGHSGHGNKSTGPRSSEGKAKSKQNAITHGIFSRVVVLKGESQQEYDALLGGLQEACLPVGALENTVVDKMATILWRHKRLILAECGDVGQNWMPSFSVRPKLDSFSASYQASKFVGKGDGGVLADASEPETLTKCVIKLKDLRNRLRGRGFEEDSDRQILGIIYGEAPGQWTYADEYDHWLKESKNASKSTETSSKNQASTKQCLETAVELLEREIVRLQGIADKKQEAEPENEALARLRGNIPSDQGMDRILRYEASLERAFDRALTQLERLQRMRLGQPVVPPIKLDVNN